MWTSDGFDFHVRQVFLAYFNTHCNNNRWLDHREEWHQGQTSFSNFHINLCFISCYRTVLSTGPLSVSFLYALTLTIEPVADLGFVTVVQGGGVAKRISRGRRAATFSNLVNLSKFTNFRQGGIKLSAKRRVGGTLPYAHSWIRHCIYLWNKTFLFWRRSLNFVKPCYLATHTPIH